MEIVVIALLVPEHELFDTWQLEPLFRYFQRETIRPDVVASSHFVGALRAAIEIQYTFDSCGSTIEPLPEISDTTHLYKTAFDGTVAIRRAFRAVPKPKKGQERTVKHMVLVSESKAKLTKIYEWIGTGDRPRPVPDLQPGDFIVMNFTKGELRGLTWSGESVPAGVA